MTAFVGVYSRRGTGTAAQDVWRRALASLSRHPGNTVVTHVEERILLAKFDIGALGSPCGIRIDERAVSMGVGDPLLSVARGVECDDRENAFEALHRSLVQRDDGELRRATGGFSFAFWDRKGRKLAIVSDKLALRPVYYFLDKELAVFSTSLRVMRATLGERAVDDPASVAQAAAFGMCYGARTTIAGVSALHDGEIVEIGNETAGARRYWNWSQYTPCDHGMDGTIDAVHDAFMTAVKRRVRSKTADAFLSGGLDSRCVVGALLVLGLDVRTFNASYQGSADQAIGQLAAERMRTKHYESHRTPSDRIMLPTDVFAAYAREAFPAPEGTDRDGPRVMWSGDGGSVGMGHVYMTDQDVERCRTPDGAQRIADALEKQALTTSRSFHRRFVDLIKDTIGPAIREEIDALSPTESGRKVFLFYLLNDQRRHLYEHYEAIDQHRVEFQTPFFDSDLLSTIIRSPIDYFLSHRLYNEWLKRFPAYVHGIPWQAYPGHVPCPHPAPPGLRGQWEGKWYADRQTRKSYLRLANNMLSAATPRFAWYVRTSVLRALAMAEFAGIPRYRYEIEAASRVARALALLR